MHRKKSQPDIDEHRELFVVVAYDIASDKRRNQVVNLLKNHGGYRVNFSVFECRLKKKVFQKLKDEIGCLMDPMADSVLYYRLCKTCWNHIEKAGVARSVYFENALFF
jgi:CRISPR-associated protein Cas2